MNPTSIASHAFKPAARTLTPALLREIFQATPLYIFSMAVQKALAAAQRR